MRLPTLAFALLLPFAALAGTPAPRPVIAGPILNLDSTQFFFEHTSAQMSNATIDAYIDLVADSGIRTFISCVNAQKANYASKVWEHEWSHYDPAGPDMQAVLKHLAPASIPPTRQRLDGAKRLADLGINLHARLLAQEIELAFLMGPLSISNIRNRVLGDYPIGFVASPSLGLGKESLTTDDLAKFPIITFPRRTQPYEWVRSLFNRPDLPAMRLHASASLATVIHMTLEGLGIAVIPRAIVENEIANGSLQLLSTDVLLPPLTFSASWLASPDTAAIELVADLAVQLAQKARFVS